MHSFPGGLRTCFAIRDTMRCIPLTCRTKTARPTQPFSTWRTVERVVITKDADFVNSFHLARRPGKLLLISTGNIANAQLADLLLPNLDAIVTGFATAEFVELTRTSLIIHA
jgi:predicted nuclease of predicted toxin-antitoxin system